MEGMLGYATKRIGAALCVCYWFPFVNVAYCFLTGKWRFPLEFGVPAVLPY